MDAGNRALVAGEFSKINDIEAPRLARLNKNGLLDSSFDIGSGPNNTVFSMVLDDSGAIYIGGLFNEVNGSVRNYLARLAPGGALDTSFSAGNRIGGSVFDIELGWDRILIAGDEGLVALALDGSRAGGFTPPDIDGDVFAVTSQSNGSIIIAGEFSTVNGIVRNNLARLNQDGSVDESFDPGLGPNASVHSLALDSDGILIGGLFVAIDGLSARRFARLDFNGRMNRDFKIGSGFNGPVQTIYRRLDGRYLIGGSFDRYDGYIQDNAVLLSDDGSLVRNDLNMLHLNGTVYSVSELAGGSTVVGGSFTKVKELGYNNFAILDHISSVRPPLLGILAEKNGFQLTVAGDTGQDYHLEFSDDLNVWLPLTKVTIPDRGDVAIDLGQFSGSRYYRAVYEE
jgi:hypothetical protein